MGKGLLFFVGRAIFTLVILWLIFKYQSASQLLETFASLDMGWMLAGLSLVVVQILVLAWRWQLLCVVVGGKTPPFALLLFALGRSMLVGQFLPATVGADAVRAVSLVQAIGIQHAARSVICDRLLGVFALAVMVSAELPVLAQYVPADAATDGLYLAAAAAVAGFLILFAARRWLVRIPFAGPLAAIVVDDLSRAVVTWPGRLAFVMGFAAHGLSVLAFVAFVRSIDAQISPIVGSLVILPSLLVVAVPISLGGWGVREATIVSGFKLLGAASAPALSASILAGLSGLLIGALIELLALGRHAFSVPKSRSS